MMEVNGGNEIQEGAKALVGSSGSTRRIRGA